MQWLISKIKSVKWLGWVVLAGAVAVLTLVVRGLFAGPKTPGKRLPEVPEKLKAKVEKAEEDALIARVKAKADLDRSNRVFEAGLMRKTRSLPA